MKESLDKAKEELRRVDHLTYVSLKYTRTVDIILSIIERMVAAYGFIIDALLKKAKEDKKIDSIPDRDFLKGELVKNTYDDEIFHENMNLYFLLRKLKNAECEKSNEYRRHVTMTSEIDGKTINVDIDIITDYYKKIQNFIKYVEELIYDRKND